MLHRHPLRWNRMGMFQRSMAIVGAVVFILATLAAAPSSAETQAALPSVTLPAPLARVLTDYEAAWQSKDAAALAALFTEDGFVLSSGKPPVRGRAEIEKHYAGQGGPLALRALAFATGGSTGYIIGGFARAKGEPDIGKFTLTLRKAGGRWMIMSDMDNANARRQAADSGAASGRVVFVCEHGSVKSVIAAHWFNRLAAERNLPFRATSRGVSPDDAIPPAVAANLAGDGFDVAGFTPKPLEAADVSGTVHVVAIGVESPLFAAAGVPVSRWSDIPPASTDYAASRDAMRARMGALLDSLARTR
jgi:ketosteroid isomerase-like protein